MAKKKSKPTRLSKTEKAVLARFQKSSDLFEEYKTAVAELAAAQEAVESAKQALHEIPSEHITTISDVDPDAAELFRSLGLYDGPADPPAADPNQPAQGSDQPAQGSDQPAQGTDQQPAQGSDQPAGGSDDQQSGSTGHWLQGH